MSRRDPSLPPPQPSTQSVLRRVAQDRVDHEREVRLLARRARAFNTRQAGQSTSPSVVPISQELPVPLDAALVARVDHRHPFDLPWARIDRAVASALLTTPGRPDTEPLIGSDLVSTLDFQEGLGLNGLKAYQTEDAPPNTRFGSGADQLSDARTVGADVVRQFGIRDLLWGMLTDGPRRVEGTGGSPSRLAFDVPTPVPTDEDELGRRLQEGRAFDFEGFDGSTSGEASNVERLGEQLAQAYKNKLRLRFTFLSLGGGSETVLQVDHDRAADTMGEYPDWSHLHLNVKAWAVTRYPGTDKETERDTVNSWLAAIPANTLRMYWSPEHLRPDDLSKARTDPLTWAAASYALASLDFRYSFQRASIRSIAYRCAGLLVDAGIHAKSLLEDEEYATASLFRLDEVLDGVELFNECELRTIFQGKAGTVPVHLVEATADMWAKGVVMASLGFIEGFHDLGVTRPSLYLPGLSSYSAADREAATLGPTGSVYEFPSSGDSSRSWTWRTVFLDALCQRIALTWSFIRGEMLHLDSAALPYSWVPSLREVFAGVDLHWYHFTVAGSDLGALHAGWLMTEVAAVSSLLNSRGFPSEVTVFENCASEDEADFHVYPDGTTSRGETERLREAFQASEAWRRLLAAKAAGAVKVSWHPLAEQSEQWDECGLRDPPDSIRAPAEETVARTVYFAYHRVGLLLRSPATVGLVLPTTLPARGSSLLEKDNPNKAFLDDPVLVFEIRDLGITLLAGAPLRELRTAAYVFLVDPTSDSTAEHRLNIRPDTGSLDGAKWMQPYPKNPEDWLIPSTDSSALPRYLLDESIELEESGLAGSGDELTLRRGDPPRILLSPCLLRIERR